jgi:methionine sulfoxide reductase catalytic subunit
MIPFDDAHRTVHYPNDRRFRVWVRPSLLVGLLVLALAPVVLAWVQNAVFGLPYIAPSPASQEGAASGPHGFPFWTALYTTTRRSGGVSLSARIANLRVNRGAY